MGINPDQAVELVYLRLHSLLLATIPVVDRETTAILVVLAVQAVHPATLAKTGVLVF